MTAAGWRGQWQQEREGSSSRKERVAAAGRRGQQWQEGEGSDGGMETGLPTAGHMTVLRHVPLLSLHTNGLHG